jgi:hypothetical protein
MYRTFASGKSSMSSGKPVFDDADISSGKCEHCLAMKFRSKHYRGTK